MLLSWHSRPWHYDPTLGAHSPALQTPPHGGTTAKHPLPLAQGWRWLARFVNDLKGYVKKGHPPPVPTGPVLEWFLKVGFAVPEGSGPV